MTTCPDNCIAKARYLAETEIHQEALDEEKAVSLASRCFMSSDCDDCDLCRYFCPDLCITRDSVSNQIVIDYNYCKGCGLCAFICPKNAITMESE